jgi:D-alanyl-lipoteichoic acid acyltransferase DltB (MBOAT superfamily)
VLVIFLLSGFWHGASWNFIIWGGVHALAFIPLLLREKNRVHVDVVASHKIWPGAKELLQMIFTFAFVTFAWIFFRSASLTQTLHYLQSVPKGLFTRPANLSFLVFYVIPFVLLEWHLRRDERVLLLAKNAVVRYLIYILLVFLLLYHSGNNAEFIYFQF